MREWTLSVRRKVSKLRSQLAAEMSLRILAAQADAGMTTSVIAVVAARNGGGAKRNDETNCFSTPKQTSLVCCINLLSQCNEKLLTVKVTQLFA